MINPLDLIFKFIKSSNQKDLDRIGKIVNKTNLLEESAKALKDKDFPKKNNRIKRKN